MSVEPTIKPDAQNGQPPHSFLSELTGIIEDHLNLAALEGQYEIERATKKFVALAFSLILFGAAFLLAQVAVIYGLSLIMPIWAASLLLAVVYGAAAGGLVWRLGRRDPKVGPAFA